MSVLSDDEVAEICLSLLESATGAQGSDVSIQRAKAIDYYSGDMDEYLPHEEDRSSAVVRDVMDTIEWVMPSLLRIFTEADNAIVFSPVNPADEQQAMLETEVVKHIFFDQNSGFLNLYTFFKDALWQRAGIFKCWWDEPVMEEEEHNGISYNEFTDLLMQGWQAASVTGPNQTDSIEDEEPRYDVKLERTVKPGKVCVDCVPPNEFGVADDATSPDPKKAKFIYHQRVMTLGELAEDGYDIEILRIIPAQIDRSASMEDQAKDEMGGEWAVGGEKQDHWSLRTVVFTQCYVRLDADDDGVMELLDVKLVTPEEGNVSSYVLLGVDEIESSYISAATPIIIPHRFGGLSLADVVMEIQEIRTQLLRSILDNTYLSNNGRLVVNENVNIADALDSRPGGIVRVRGKGAPGENLLPLASPPLSPIVLSLMQMMQEELKQRTGVGDEVMGLDADALANANTGVVAQAFDAARMRIELIARVLAETGLKGVFQDIHALAREYHVEPMDVKLRSGWNRVQPSTWRQRDDIEVQVGVGRHTKERNMMSLANLAQSQKAIVEGGGLGRLVTEGNLYNMAVDQARALGQDPDRYFTDPKGQPPPQPKPDPAMMSAQAQVQLAQQRLKLDEQKMQMDAQLQQGELAVKQGVAQEKLMAQKINEQSQIMAQMVAAQKTQADAMRAEQQLILDRYKADLSASVDLLRAGQDAQLKILQEVLKQIGTAPAPEQVPS